MFNVSNAVDLFVSEVINVFITLLFVLTGGVLPLWERKFLSLTQRRVGPKFVGYKGRLQFIADALKVFFKDYLVLFYVNKYFFFLVPIMFLNLNLLFWINMVFYGNCLYVHVEYNFLFLLFFSMLSNLFLFFVGIYNKNKYTILTSNRILNLLYVNELFVSMMFSLFFVYINSFNFQRIFFYKLNTVLLITTIALLPMILYLFLLDINKVPFDMVESESELIMGYHIEYSGFLFGLFVLVEYLHLFFFMYILYLLLSF